MVTTDSNFGIKLKKRRNEKGLSLQKLADVVGVSKQSIFRFENGEQEPNTRILLKLSEELNVRPSYFFEDDKIDIEINDVDFRDDSKGGFDFLGIKNQCKEWLQNFIELEAILKIDNNFENPLKGLLIGNSKDVEKAAKQIRKKWKLGEAAISNVVHLLERKGVYVYEVQIDDNRFSGLCGCANESIPFIVLNSNVQDNTRKRLTALHELAHLVLEFVEDLDAKKIESYCNHFAGAILLTGDTLVEELGRNRSKISLHELIEIKKKYGVSIKAIIVRARKTNLISYETYCDWFESYNEWYDKQESFGSYESVESPSAFSNLIIRALNEERITWGKAAELNDTKIDFLKSKLANYPDLEVV